MTGFSTGLLRGAVLIFFAVLPACVSVDSDPTLSPPVFMAEPGDLKRFRALARRQEMFFDTCAESHSCAHLHFTRALVALFEDRSVARQHFEQVLDLAPESRMASSSKLWIKLIEEDERANPWNRFLDGMKAPDSGKELYAWSTEQLVQDLLDRELLIEQLMHLKELDTASLQALQRKLSERGKQVEKLSSKHRTLRDEQPSVQILRRQIAIRDKKIKELNSQLEALKRIDQEMRQKTRPAKPAPSSNATGPKPKSRTQ